MANNNKKKPQYVYIRTLEGEYFKEFTYSNSMECSVPIFIFKEEKELAFKMLKTQKNIAFLANAAQSIRKFFKNVFCNEQCFITIED